MKAARLKLLAELLGVELKQVLKLDAENFNATKRGTVEVAWEGVTSQGRPFRSSMTFAAGSAGAQLALERMGEVG